MFQCVSGVVLEYDLFYEQRSVDPFANLILWLAHRASVRAEENKWPVRGSRFETSMLVYLRLYPTDLPFRSVCYRFNRPLDRLTTVVGLSGNIGTIPLRLVTKGAECHQSMDPLWAE